MTDAQLRTAFNSAGLRLTRQRLLICRELAGRCDHPDVDYLYRDELAAWEQAGVVSVRPAFYKAPQGDVAFVQHRLWQDRADVAGLFQKGASVYVCGDGRRMAPAVRETCVRIYREAVGAAPEAAEAWMEKIERESGRYVSDVFA